MKTMFIVLATFVLFSTGVMADTVPSTYDPNCNINWAGGGCGEKMIGSGAGSLEAGVTDGSGGRCPRDEDCHQCGPKGYNS